MGVARDQYRVHALQRTIGPAQAAQTVGPIIALDTVGFDPNSFEQMVVALTGLNGANVVFAYTGGATNPTLDIIIQRKIRPDLDDSVNDAWEDIMMLSMNAAATEIGDIGNDAIGVTAGADTSFFMVHNPSRDGSSIAGDGALPSRAGPRLRVRERTTGGDRTGGTATYDLVFAGIKRAY